MLWREDEVALLDFDFADGVWDFFFFLVEVVLDAVLWPDAGRGAKELEAIKAITRLSTPKYRPRMEREVREEKCTLMYQL